MTEKTITFAQLRACIRAAEDVLGGCVTNEEMPEHVEMCAADRECAQFDPAMVDLVGMLVTFGDTIGRGRRAA